MHVISYRDHTQPLLEAYKFRFCLSHFKLEEYANWIMLSNWLNANWKIQFLGTTKRVCYKGYSH